MPSLACFFLKCLRSQPHFARTRSPFITPIQRVAFVANTRRGSSSSRVATSLPSNVAPAAPVVLVKIGSDGKDSVFRNANVEGMDRMALLKAIRADEGFTLSLKDLPLDKCAVLIVSSATTVPSEGDELAAIELLGANTIRDAIDAMSIGIDPASRRNIFLRVRLPLSMSSFGFRGEGP